ncbi:MAG: LEPR-XLL domain-containing protein, partial [Verrucomicrobiota bacterium]
MFRSRHKSPKLDVFARSREKAAYAVEPLEPKILLSAAPVDAPLIDAGMGIEDWDEPLSHETEQPGESVAYAAAGSEETTTADVFTQHATALDWGAGEALETTSTTTASTDSPVELEGGALQFETGDAALNGQLQDVLAGGAPLSTLSQTSFSGTLLAGNLTATGTFAIGETGNLVYLLGEDIVLDLAPSGEAEAGLAVAFSSFAFAYDSVADGFLLTGGGSLGGDGLGFEIGGQVTLEWNALGRALSGETLSAGGLSQTLSLADGVARMSGTDLEIAFEAGSLEFEWSVSMGTAAAAVVTTQVSGGSLVFSSSPRANVRVDGIAGTFVLTSGSGESLALTGSLNATFNGLSIPASTGVDVTYANTGADPPRVVVSTPGPVAFSLADRAATAAIRFEAASTGGSVPEFLFGFSDFSMSSADVSLADGSGVLLANLDGVAAQLYGTAQIAAGPAAAGARVELRLNTTLGEVDRTVDFGTGSVRLLFGAGETTANFFQFAVVDALLEIGEHLQVQGNFSWTEGVLQIGGVDYRTRTIVSSQLELFLSAAPNVAGVWAPDLGTTGFLLGSGQLAVVEFVDLNAFAAAGQGLGQELNLAGASFSGTANFRYNGTGLAFDQTVYAGSNPGTGVRLNFATTAPVLEMTFSTLALNVAGQTAQARATIQVSGGELRAAVSEATTTFSAGSASLRLVNGAGQFLFQPGQAAGRFGGTIVKSGFDFFEVSGDLGFEFNTGGAPVSFMTGGATVSLPAGPFVRLAGRSVNLATQGERLTGSFAFENAHLAAGSTEVRAGQGESGDRTVLAISAANLALSTGGLDAGEMILGGALVASSDFLAGQVAGSFAYAASDIAIAGNLDVTLNTGSSALSYTSPL